MKLSHPVGIAVLVISLINNNITIADSKSSEIENSVKITPLSVDFIKKGRSLGMYLCIPSDGYLGQAYLFNTDKSDSTVLNEEGYSKKTWFKFTDIFSGSKVMLFTKKQDEQLTDSKTMRPYTCNPVKISPSYQI
jgi:hypothetical protein